MDQVIQPYVANHQFMGSVLVARDSQLDDAEAKRIADAAAAFAQRFKDQTAVPGSDATLRKWIEDLRIGKPNYEMMSAGLGAATRAQLSQLQSTITGLGALQSVS